MARGQTGKRPSVSGPHPAIGGVGTVGGSLTIDPSLVPALTNIPVLPSPTVATSTGSSNKRPATTSLALKTRRYIDININDVKNERARGKWTEEDDRMWKRTKPYECEICGERGSTRYNIENRHKVNRHSPQKVIPCPDCKLMFTRKDNLIKHQKKAHPDKFHSQPQTPPSDGPPPAKTRTRRTAEPKVTAPVRTLLASSIATSGEGQLNYGMNELEGAFKTLPIAEDLPSRQAQGLMAKSNPNSLPFLPPSLLAHYADYYFSDNTFHSHMPLLHKPTFKADRILASFLRSVCCVGNIYDPTNRSMGKELWESGWKVMERWIEKGSEADSFLDGGFAEVLKEESPDSSAAGAERRHREGRLEVLQGLVLFEFYGLFADDRFAQKKARRLHYKCVEIAREHGYLYEKALPSNYQNLSLQEQWELFIEVESRKRTAYSLYILDCNLSLLFNTPRLLRLQELKFLSLPCDDVLFEAANAEEWDRIRRQDEDYHLLHDGSGVYSGSRGEKILFGAIYKKLVQGEGRVEEEYLGKEARLNDYAAYLMVVGIIMEILALTQRVAEEEEEPNTRTKRGGKTVVVFPHHHTFEIERLRRCLDTLGKLPRFGPILMVEKQRAYEVLKCSLGHQGQVDQMIQVAAPLPLELEGCAKSFYVAWHLAHIMLVIPDRMCLRNEETPLDMNTSWAHILLETKDRLEKVSRFSPGPMMDSQPDTQNNLGTASSSWGAGQSHMLFSQVFEDKIAPHLFALLRFAGKSAGYTFEMWDAEFPTVLGMIFKALVVAWELIVRVGREEEERRSLMQAIPQPLIGYGTRAPAYDFGVNPQGMWGIPVSTGLDWMYNTSTSSYVDDGGYFPWNPNTTLDNQQYNQEQQDVKPNIHLLQQQQQSQSNRQRGTGTPGENFLQELLAFVKYHERLDGDMELAGKELLEWRFLRWMRNVFDEIDGWDVGRAVVKVMDGVLFNYGEDDMY